MIRITSKRENFRRCGVAHPKAATEHPDNKFSKKELAILENEPMLTVGVLESDAKKKADAEAKAKADADAKKKADAEAKAKKKAGK